MTIKYGCHGSTWELDYDKETDYLEAIMDTVKNTGFKGLDIQISLLGKFKESPERLKGELQKRGLELAALTIPFSWENEQETDEEIELSKKYIGYLKHFPNALMNVAPRVGKNRDYLVTRQQNIIKCANNLAKRVSDEGIVCSFHPSSPPTSYFRTESDYEVLFDGLNSTYIGYTPDAGHIAMGGMDVVKTIQKYMPLIKHVHFKDASAIGKWKKMGTGEVDFPAIVKELMKANYKGWIMVEEETEESTADPAKELMDIRKYVSQYLLPSF
ncbi:sugar phosphate isomerase/epimerase [Sporosarcina oncorhynchi]|uniref:Sugar phosphate isomerase/epimerase n=1 Tax=Sporosarcina oncorhynchi TaxID=3056444 RepID=A0ABZ0L788_9BACL|nr:sugar phosphate isomerase/epimerase [Sporosarcina sp. T2O-4]WOV88097.1 sugar phosphate isomerase/epimerase [Sporosarcina sp. T2O-4]